MTSARRLLDALLPLGTLGTLARFPIPAACALAATLFAIATEVDVPFVVNDEASRTLAFLLLALFASSATAIWGERVAAAPWRRFALTGLGVALLAARIYTLPLENSLAALMLAPGTILLAASLPFVGEPASEAAFWLFNRGAWLGSLFGLVIAGALGLGLTLAYAAADELLGLDVGGSFYAHTWTVCLCLVWPLVAFGTCPPARAPETREAGRLVTVLTTYVLVPVVGIYGAILYLYVARIAVMGHLPAGEVASTVGGCAAIAVATHYLAFPLRETGARWVRAFHRHAFKALLVPIGVLALAVWVRVDAYGFTEPRFVLALGTAWLAVLTVHGMIWPARRLAVMPAALCALMFLGSFGPWGAIAVSTRSQVASLETLLSEAGILVNGRVQRIDAQPPFEAARRISSIVVYLHDTGKIGVIAPWFDMAEDAATGGPEAWLDRMGVSLVSEWQTAETFDYGKPADAALDVQGFDVAIAVHVSNGASPATFRWTGTGSTRDVVVALDGDRVTVTTLGGDTLVFALTPLAETLRSAPAPTAGAPAPFVEATTPALRGRFVIDYLHGRWADGVLADVYGSGTILLDAR